ncbi:GTPase IMAP family member 7-like isoform X2 [Brachyhypopomus gauderio]|uniref:GTPase IMAP family member 7-like isoform X2 n=1 Tax=Brachyhypopomus gauderio TaxID=698409 RepID=UPI004040F617
MALALGQRRSSFELIPPNMSTEDTSLRIIVFGTSGPHQYLLTESILQRDIFNVDGTTLTTKTSGQLFRRNVTLVNTPNLNSPDISHNMCQKELRKAVCFSCPGPHSVIITLDLLDVPSDACQIFKPVVQHFGEAILNHTMVVLYHKKEGDCQSLVDSVRKNKDFGELLEMCGQRYLVFSGNTTRKDNSATEELFNMIDQIVKEHGIYSNQEFQDADKRIKKEERFIKKEREKEVRKALEAIKKTHSGEDLTREVKRYEEQIQSQNRERAEVRVADKLGFALRLVDYAVAIGKGAFVGSLLGSAMGIVGTVVGATVGAALGGVYGGAAREAWQYITNVFTYVHRETT